MTQISEVQAKLEAHRDLLEVTEQEDYIIVKPKNYIADRNAYSDIGRIMHTFNAEYLQEGKIKIWRVSKLEANTKLSLEASHIQKAKEHFKQAVESCSKGMAELEQAGY